MRIRIRLNPIVKKDVKVQARSARICISTTAYVAVLALIYFYAMVFISQGGYYDTQNIYSRMVWLYPILAVTQLVIIALVVPIRSASAISGEKERQTFDIMMTTTMPPFAIVFGKAATAMLQSMFFVVAAMPVMALVFVVGGMSWSYLFYFLCVVLLISFLAASIGIFCSSICKRSITAVIMSFGFYVIFFVATFVPLFVTEVVAELQGNGVGNFAAMIFLLANPVFYLIDFFTKVMSGEAFSSSLISQATNPPALLVRLAGGNWWIAVSTIVLIGISFILLMLAAWRINPVGRHRAKMKGGTRHG